MKKRLIVIVVGGRDEMKGCFAVVGGAHRPQQVYTGQKTSVVRSLLPTSQGLWKPNSGLQGCLEHLDWPNHLTNPKEIKLLSMVAG